MLQGHSNRRKNSPVVDTDGWQCPTPMVTIPPKSRGIDVLRDPTTTACVPREVATAS